VYQVQLVAYMGRMVQLLMICASDHVLVQWNLLAETLESTKTQTTS